MALASMDFGTWAPDGSQSAAVRQRPGDIQVTDDDRKTLLNLMQSSGYLMRAGMDREDALKADLERTNRDVANALTDYHDECARSRALLTALEDIALCH